MAAIVIVFTTVVQSVFTITLLLSPSFHGGCPAAAAAPSSEKQWVRLTSQNFTSDIAQHRFVLCISTVPWCGESRSIMKELLSFVETTDDDDLSRSVQLRVIYVNFDRELGFMLHGGKKTPSFTLYRDAVPYKYTGRVRVHNIIAGIRYGLSSPSNDLPFKKLSSFSEVQSFIEFTDKAIILFDFCNWSEKLGHIQRKLQTEGISCNNALGCSTLLDGSNSSEASYGFIEKQMAAGDMEDNEDAQTRSHKVEGSRLVSSSAELEILEMSYDSAMTGGIEASSSGLYGESSTESQIGSEDALSTDCEREPSWWMPPNMENHLSTPLLMRSNYGEGPHQSKSGNRIKDNIFSDNQGCNHTEYNRFSILYRNLTVIAQAHVLTPEQMKFGVITKKSLLFDLDIVRMQNHPWFLMNLMADRPGAPNLYFEVEGIDYFLSKPEQLVPELHAELSSYYTSLSNDTPTMILFIDRASPSIDIRKWSWGSLKVFQTIVREYVGNEQLGHRLMGGEIARKNGLSSQKDGQIEGQEAPLHGWLASESFFSHLARDNTLKWSITDFQVEKEEKGSDNIAPQIDEPVSKMFIHMLEGDENMQLQDSPSEVSYKGFPSLQLEREISQNEDVPLDEKEDVIGTHSADTYKNGTIEGKTENTAGADTESNKEVEVDHRIEGEILEDSQIDGASFDGRVDSSFGKTTNIKNADKLTNSVKLFVLTGAGKVLGNSQLIGQSAVLDSLLTKGDLDIEVLKSDNGMQDIETLLLPDETPNSGLESEEEQAMSFFFVDGQDHLMDMILPGLTYPSIIILDPHRGGQFVFPNNQSIDYHSVKHFMVSYSEKTLKSTYRSESQPQKPRQRVKPPFVNRDFHEVNGVPRVTVDTFSQTVFGFEPVESSSESGLENVASKTKERTVSSRNNDVLVLFTAPWCGFCKRIELVFREVHQLFTEHLPGSPEIVQKAQEVYKQVLSKTDLNVQDQYGEDFAGGLTDKFWASVMETLPLLAQMDCSANDCADLLKWTVQGESYPSVIMFPSNRKDNPIVYDGGPTVYEILEFLAAGGNVGAKALQILQEHTWKSKSSALFKTTPGYSAYPLSLEQTQIESPNVDQHIYPFRAEEPRLMDVSSSIMSDAHNKHDSSRPINYPTVGSVLVATDLLSKTLTVFKDSIILIVRADGQEGFQGLIVNKPVHWKKVLPGLDNEMEQLVNRTVLCYGGPVIMQGQPFLSLTRVNDLEGFTEVVPGVHFGGPVTTMHILKSIRDGQIEAADFWFFVGSANWGWQQLLDELAAHVWQLTNYAEGLIQLPVQEWLNGLNFSVLDLQSRSKVI